MSTQGYHIDIRPHPGRASAMRQGVALATSSKIRILQETRLGEYYYFPKEAVDAELLEPSDLKTFCPFKGTATYWHIKLPDETVKNGAWSYENPLNESAGIGGLLSFSSNVIDGYDFEHPPEDNHDDGHINSALSDWILREAGYCNSGEELVQLLGRKFVESGIAVYRMNVIIWSLHPEIAGIIFQWKRDTGSVEIAEPSHDLFTNEAFLNSPIRRVYQGMGGVRQPLNVEDTEFEFSILDELKAEGATDYVAMPLRFSDGQFNVMTLACDHENGFSTENLGLIFECMGVISRYLEVFTLRANQETLLNTYLGPRTGKKVLAGDIRRGQGEDIQAIILFSDLRNSSRLAEELPRQDYLRLLNQYFDSVLGPISEQGGEVLKFIGDAVLAIFPVTDTMDDRSVQAQKALAAAQSAVANRNNNGVDVDFGIALHIGDVTYGNVGSSNRLDFTVIGPAVNLASRIEGLCKSTGNRILLSQDFKTALEGSGDIIDLEQCDAEGLAPQSIGEHQFDGISANHTVYTL